MSVFKEEVKVLEFLKKQQTRVWPDSADVGIEATDDVKSIIRPAIKTLLEFGDSNIISARKHPVIEYEYEFKIHFSMEDGIIFNVVYFKGNGKEFFSIYSRRAESLVS